MTQLDVSSDSESDGPRALHAGPAVILLAASPALAPRGDICNLFHLEFAHHLNHMLEGLLVLEAVAS